MASWTAIENTMIRKVTCYGSKIVCVIWCWGLWRFYYYYYYYYDYDYYYYYYYYYYTTIENTMIRKVKCYGSKIVCVIWCLGLWRF